MHCNKCGQPLQPWEVTTREPCLRRIQNFPNLQLTETNTAATLPQTPSKVQGEINKQGGDKWSQQHRQRL